MGDSNSEAGHPTWNPALERVIQKEGEGAESLYWLHNEAARWAQFRNDAIQIPSIIIATLTGFLSATEGVLPPVAIGVFSVGVGILNTINSYFKFSQRSEAHRITSLLYLKTYKDIECQLSLPVDQRKDAEVMLADLRGLLERVSETAPPLPRAVITLYKEKFKDTAIHTDIQANGLDAIAIYKGPLARPTTPRAPSLDSAATPAAPPRPDIKISIKAPPVPATPMGGRLAV
jgi:hypothetical protein